MKSLKALLKIIFVILLILAAAYLTGNMSIFSYAQAAVNYIRETLSFGVDHIRMAISEFQKLGF